jgi:hypothetical protein
MVSERVGKSSAKTGPAIITTAAARPAKTFPHIASLFF